MSADTTELSYWLTWRFFICLAYVLVVIAAASFVIWKYEGPGSTSSFKSKRKEEENHPRSGYLHNDDTWKTSRTRIHPAYLLVYRLCSFIGLLSILAADIQSKGVIALYFYTQWTFALVTLYFGVGSVFSIHGCRVFYATSVQEVRRNVQIDSERIVYDVVPQEIDSLNAEKDADTVRQSCDQASAGLLGYSFQVIFQVAAGAAMLSDSVFWFLIYPFILPESFRLDFLVFSMHSLNVILLIGDAFLNNLRWPYPFLDLSSPYAPAWYMAIGLIMLPSFGLFALIMKFKHFLLSKFPESDT